jgi:ABC-type glutathione transport system ATPase component
MPETQAVVTPEKPVLEVEDLTVNFRRRGADIAAVNKCSFVLNAGRP